jgi:hypothetical protein
MTVVSGMIFNPEEGALIADEQSSGQVRKYDIAKKLHNYSAEGGKVKAAMGGSGSSEFLHAVDLQIEEGLKTKRADEIPNGEALADFIGQNLLSTKIGYLDNYLRTNLGPGWQDFQAGNFLDANRNMRQIEPSLMENFKSLMGGRDERSAFFSNNGILLMTSEPGKIKLYNLMCNITKPIPISRPYESIGSGSDMADQVIYSFFENQPREKRESINPIEGLVALLHATERASAVNQGVGGVPYITVLKQGEIIQPCENNSKLAAEIVKAEKKGMLNKGFSRTALYSLLYKNEDFETVETEMFARAKDKTDLDRMLRGYRQ